MIQQIPNLTSEDSTEANEVIEFNSEFDSAIVLAAKKLKN